MSFDTAKNAIRAYLELLHQNDKKKGEIHFFGGEPMIVPELVQFAVEYARYEAGKK
jgi:sulfatase maturation enzyme AslB (radical SAM superfamily)